MTTTHHTEAHGHSHPFGDPQKPLRASQVPSVPRHWVLRAGITVAAVVLAVVSLAFGSNDDTSHAPSIVSSVVAR